MALFPDGICWSQFLPEVFPMPFPIAPWRCLPINCGESAHFFLACPRVTIPGKFLPVATVQRVVLLAVNFCSPWNIHPSSTKAWPTTRQAFCYWQLPSVPAYSPSPQSTASLLSLAERKLLKREKKCLKALRGESWATSESSTVVWGLQKNPTEVMTV